MAKKLTILGILALLAVPASASTFLMFMQNGGTPTPLNITDNPGNPGGTTISLTDAPILWAIPNTLSTGYRTGLLTFNAYTSERAQADMVGNNIYENGFSGSVSIRDPVTSVWLSWTFELTGTLTVANNGHTGSFVDSKSLSSEGVYASGITLPTLTSETFHFSLFDATSVWQSNGSHPIIWDAAMGGACTNCRLASNTTSIFAPDDSGAPEPATMAMLGSALIGLGLLGRKRFVR